jgi:adenosylmethionine-8-amino-7-oxononanoate aminotransferase
LASFADHPLVGEVSGVGMIGALELVADKETKQPFEGMKVGQFCAKAAEENGLVIRPLGGNRVALCPPLIIEREHVDEIADKLGAALNTTLDWVTAEGLR